MKKLAIILAVLIVLFGLGAFAYYWFLLRGPLAGETSHDFGIVTITADKADVSHTFHLTNRTDHALRIERIVPECGCVQVAPGSATVDSGQSIALRATLSVSSDGVKRTPIRLMLGDDGVQILRVKATGKRIQSSLPLPGEPTTRPDAVSPGLPASSP